MEERVDEIISKDETNGGFYVNDAGKPVAPDVTPPPVDVVNSPMYATGVGLILYGSRHHGNGNFKVGEKNLFSKVTARMKKWFEEFF